MKREIKSAPVVHLTAKSFDGINEIEFNEGSHRYKLNGKPAVGVTTFCKAGYPTSMGLNVWMKSQAAQSVFQALTVPGVNGYMPREGFWPIVESTKAEIIKTAKSADKEVAQEAADIGTICHAYAEFFSVGKIKESDELIEKVKGIEKWPLIESCIKKYLEWEGQNRGKLLHAESLVGSEKWHFCGKFDRLDDVAGKLILRDYKTSKSIYLDQYIQLGAYALAIKEWLNLDVSGLEVLRFGKEDGEFENLLVDDPAEIKMFQQQALACLRTYHFRKLENDVRWAWKGATK